MFLASLGRKTPRCQQRKHSRTCCSSCRVILLVGCFLFIMFFDVCDESFVGWQIAAASGKSWNLMLNCIGFSGNWRVGSVAAEEMFLLLQQEPAPAAEEVLQDDVLVFFDLVCGCYKGVCFLPGLETFRFLCLYRHPKLTGALWTFAIIAIRWCKCSVVFFRWDAGLFFHVCHYFCFLDPLQIGPSSVLQCAVERKHLRVSSGYLEMSSL